METHCFEDIWLFGSYARGDVHTTSDVDVLVISEIAPDESFLAEILRDKNIEGELSFSHYSRSGISDLISNGALFAWHIRLEGVALTSKSGWLADKLKQISPYQTYIEDMKLLQVMVDETRQSLQCDNHTLNMEASVLSVALRNAAMMTAYISGQPDFSSTAIFKLRNCDPALSISNRISDRTVRDLIGARLESERGISQERQWTQSELMNIADEIATWLQQLCLINSEIKERDHATPFFA